MTGVPAVGISGVQEVELAKLERTKWCGNRWSSIGLYGGDRHDAGRRDEQDGRIHAGRSLTAIRWNLLLPPGACAQRRYRGPFGDVVGLEE